MRNEEFLSENPLNLDVRQLRAAATLPGIYNQIRGKRPELYLRLVNQRADELEPKGKI